MRAMSGRNDWAARSTREPSASARTSKPVLVKAAESTSG